MEEDVAGFIEESAFGQPEENGPAHLLREAIRATRVPTYTLFYCIFPKQIICAIFSREECGQWAVLIS